MFSSAPQHTKPGLLKGLRGKKEGVQEKAFFSSNGGGGKKSSLPCFSARSGNARTYKLDYTSSLPCNSQTKHTQPNPVTWVGFPVDTRAVKLKQNLAVTQEGGGGGLFERTLRGSRN